MNWKLMSFALLGLLMVTLGCLGLALSEPNGYTVVMSNCDESLSLLGGHVASFANLDEAQRWADEQLGYQYDIASIYTLDAPSRFSELLWIKSDACYEGQFLAWTDMRSE